MPVVLVIIIVAAWVVILGPNVVKRRARGGGDQSITHFHYQLRVLEQRAPEPIVAPAYRLRAVDGSGTPTAIQYPDNGRPPVLTGSARIARPVFASVSTNTPHSVASPSAGPRACRDGSPPMGHSPGAWPIRASSAPWPWTTAPSRTATRA